MQDSGFGGRYLKLNEVEELVVEAVCELLESVDEEINIVMNGEVDDQTVEKCGGLWTGVKLVRQRWTR